jgi:hypothetical protein
MSIFKRSDVKNHLSLRFRARTYLNASNTQPRATGILATGPDTTGEGPSQFALDFSTQHTSAGASPTSHAKPDGSAGSQEPGTSKSAQA